MYSRTYNPEKAIGKNSVPSAKLAVKLVLIIGIIIGLLYPLVIDWILFGTIEPCKTVQRFEDGSSIQKCNVKN